MGLFKGQMANVVEWQEYRDDVIFWKWKNDEIKKGSRLVIRPGQDAIFMYNGRVEGVFRDEGSFDIESDIIPFLSTLKGFKFGFNSGIRAEVLFINTKEFVVKWGTKNALNLLAPGLPGGLPIRAFGTFTCQVCDHMSLIDKVAGIREQYTVDDVKERVLSELDPLLMKWITREGKDLFNLQANASEIGQGICTDLDLEMRQLGIAVTGFSIQSVSYPEEVQKMVTKAASQSMIGDMGRYQQVAMTDAMARGGAGGRMAVDMAGMQMGMMMGRQMADQIAGQTAGQMGNQTAGQMGSQAAGQMAGQTAGQMGSQMAGQTWQQSGVPSGSGTGRKPNFCPNCGTKTNGANFCPNCGQKL